MPRILGSLEVLVEGAGNSPNSDIPRAGNAATSPHWVSSKRVVCTERSNAGTKTQGVITASLSQALFSHSKPHSLFHSPQKHKASFLSGQARREAFWQLLAGRVCSMLPPLTLPEGRQENQFCKPSHLQDFWTTGVPTAFPLSPCTCHWRCLQQNALIAPIPDHLSI